MRRLVEPARCVYHGIAPAAVLPITSRATQNGKMPRNRSKSRRSPKTTARVTGDTIIASRLVSWCKPSCARPSLHVGHLLCQGSQRCSVAQSAHADRQPAHQPYQCICGRVAPWHQRHCTTALSHTPAGGHHRPSSRALQERSRTLVPRSNVTELEAPAPLAQAVQALAVDCHADRLCVNELEGRCRVGHSESGKAALRGEQWHW